MQSFIKKRPKKVAPPPVSLGTTAREPLPYPFVYYPNHYGVFFGFAKDESSPVVMCACCNPAVENYLRLKTMLPEVRYAEPLMEAPLSNKLFPDAIAEASNKYPQAPLNSIRFEERLCHRCNLVKPTLRYCHEMYGEQFMQYYGWYVKQAYFRLGIFPSVIVNESMYTYLPDICPEEYQVDINALRAAQSEYNAERETARVRRTFTKKIEDIVRQEFGFRKVGEGWVSETMLFQILHRILPEQEVIRHYHPDWLEGLELDIYFPALQLAFEYQGQQHFHPIRTWGGQKGLEVLRNRDARKAEICKRLGVCLVTIDYTEPLTEEYIRKNLNSCNR